jgi:hypothetical protein
MLAACAEHLVREFRYCYVLIDVNIYIRMKQAGCCLRIGIVIGADLLS